MIDLYKNARPDEVFNLSSWPVVMRTWGRDWLYRSVKWQIGDPVQGDWFNSYVVLWCFRWYVGNAKVDGGRTLMLRSGELGEGPDPTYAGAYVVTYTAKEMLSFRVRWRRPDRERPLNMGGI